MSIYKMFGAGLAVAGAAIVGGLVGMLYGPDPSDRLIWLGIPGALMLSAFGLAAFLVGAAILAGRPGARREG